MKKSFLYLFAVLLAFSAAGCADDSGTRDGGEEQVVISLTPEEVLSRAGVTDDDISTFRILMFERTNGRGLRYNFYYDNFLNANKTLTLKVHKGNFDFVFVANETADAALHTLLGGLVTTDLITELDGVYLNAAAFNDTGYIPAAGIVRNVTVVEDNKLIVNSAVVTGSWNIQPYLKRLAVRIDLSVTTEDKWVWDNFTNFEIINLPSKVYLLDQTTGASPATQYNNDGTYTTSRTFTTAQCDAGTEWKNNKGTWKKARIIVPSNIFADGTDKTKAITVNANLLGVSPVSVRLGRALNSNDYTSPRNTYYTFNGTLKQSGINFTVEVAAWGAPQNVDME